METLELSVKEDPHCPRNAFYYARELYFHNRYQDAIEALDRYLKMPEAVWINDRCYAMRVMGQCYAAIGDQIAAEAWYHKAAAEAPHTREPWVALAKLYYEQHKWAESYGAATRALSIKNKELVYTTEPASWGPLPHDYAAIAAYRLGMTEAAIEQGRLAYELDPEDKRLQDNLLWYTGEKAA
jgi:tetratricopeptide (TPR) repeat protein